MRFFSEGRVLGRKPVLQNRFGLRRSHEGLGRAWRRSCLQGQRGSVGTVLGEEPAVPPGCAGRDRFAWLPAAPLLGPEGGNSLRSRSWHVGSDEIRENKYWGRAVRRRDF